LTFEYTDSTAEQVNTQICDAANCKNKATEKIEVGAGKYGYLTLFVCRNCTSKFQEDYNKCVKKDISWRCWGIKTRRPCECKLPNDCPMYAFCENWRKMEEYDKLR
jgi:hypothetical protein